MGKWVAITILITLSACCRPAPPSEKDAEASVVLQGLIAYIETKDQRNKHSIEALLVKAENPDDSIVPEIDTYFSEKTPHSYATTEETPFAPHKAFLAWENADYSDSCNLGGSQRLYLPWMELYLDAYPLCDVLGCGSSKDIAVEFQRRKSNVTVQRNLCHLVRSDSFVGDCGNEFFKIVSEVNSHIAARLKFSEATRFESVLLNNTFGENDFPAFGYCELAGGKEGECVAPEGSGIATPFAEEVRVSGKGPIRLVVGGGEPCEFRQQVGKPPMRLWILNVSPEHYKKGSKMAHHEMFYFYYNLASQECRQDGSGNKVYLRPCLFPRPLGDPKCPQVLLKL